MEFDQPCVAEIFSFLFVPLEMDIMLIYTDEFFIATIYCSKTYDCSFFLKPDEFILRTKKVIIEQR